MSSRDSLLARDLPRELEAALLGDFNHLRHGSADAQHFAKAFGSGAGQAWWEETDPDGRLGDAAKAVSCERRGESESALLLYAKTTDASSPWWSLLGLLLQGWSSLVQGPGPVLAAAEKVRKLRRSQRKARLLAKLSGFSADAGELDLAHALWQEAIDAAVQETQLYRALAIEGMNLGFGLPDVTLLEKPDDEDVDELVWPAEVPELRLKSATDALTQSLEDRFGGAWRYTIRMGITPLNDLDSAEAQARWIGAPWLRRPIQKQLGAQLLSGSASGPAQWAHGVLTWTLGGGANQNLALRYAEPNFDQEGAEYVVKGVAECDPTRGRMSRLASLGAEAWDLVPEETLSWLAGEFPPLLGLASPAPESRMIWSAFAIRSPERWFERYRKLDADIQGALLDSLEPAALRHLDEEMKASVYVALEDDEVVLAEGGRLLPFAAALAPPEDDERLSRLVESDSATSARVISRLIEERPAVVSGAAESRLLGRLRDSIVDQSEKARRGTTSMGGPGPRLELGRLLAVARSVDRRLVDLLVETATDRTLPPQYVTESRQGLVLLRRAGRLRTTDLRRLRAAPSPQSQGPLEEGLTQGVLRVLLLQILAENLTAAERSELVAAVRSPEERIRDIAVNACAEALESCHDDALAWAVVSGLFDPSDSVADGALAGLPALTLYFRPAAEVAWERLPALFDSSARRVREQIIRSLEHAPPRTSAQRNRRKALLARGRSDRSWLVRAAAEEVTTSGRGT